MRFFIAIATVTLTVSSATSGAEEGSGPVPSEAEARMPDLVPAEFDESLRIGGEEIEGQKVSSRMTVQVRINDAGPYHFIVDSGADTSVVGTRIAQQLDLPPGRATVLNGVTESTVVDQVLVDELALGPTRINQLEVPVLREFDIGGDGMIGLDALVEQRLMLDFEKRIITVDDARTPPPEMEGAIIVTGRLQRGQLILTEVQTEGVSVDAVIDTGTEISIGNSALLAKLEKRNSDDFTTVVVRGVTGAPTELRVAVVKRLKLGPVTLTNVPIAFADIPPFGVFGLEDEPSLLLGTDVMETFRRVSLDFHERKVRFELKQCDRTAIKVRTMPSSASRLSADNASACEN